MREARTSRDHSTEGTPKMRLLRRFVILAVIVGLGLKALRSLGILKGGECSPACACSQGDMSCTCGHKTCLAPSAA